MDSIFLNGIVCRKENIASVYGKILLIDKSAGHGKMYKLTLATSKDFDQEPSNSMTVSVYFNLKSTCPQILHAHGLCQTAHVSLCFETNSLEKLDVCLLDYQTEKKYRELNNADISVGLDKE